MALPGLWWKEVYTTFPPYSRKRQKTELGDRSRKKNHEKDGKKDFSVKVVPKLRSAINTAGGFMFTDDKVMIEKDYTAIIGGDKKNVAEVDMFLFNDTEAMAVEIKAQLCEDHVIDHVERLKKLRTYEEKAEIVGKKLFGAIAGIYIHPKAAEAALENGLYLVEIREEEDKLNIEKPEVCRSW